MVAPVAADDSVRLCLRLCPCPNEGADLEAAGIDMEGCKDEEEAVEDEEADDLVITPATGIRTMQR